MAGINLPPSQIPVYATTGDLPTGISSGSQGIVQADNSLYLYNGSSWIKQGTAAGVVTGSGVANAPAIWDSASDITYVGPLTNGQILVGSTGIAPVAATLTGTTHQVNVTNGAGTITLATPQNIDTTSTPTFASETLTANTNQLTLGTTNTTTVTMASLTGSRTFTLPDANSNSVQSTTATASNWLTNIDSSGVQHKTQPNFTDLLGSASVTQNGLFTPTLTLYVDGNRVDSYTADGSIGRPYKTIQAAINQAAVVGNYGGVGIEVALGTYAENITLNNANLFNLIFHSIGATVTSLSTSSNNSQLYFIRMDGFEFNNPVSLTGVTTGFAAAGCQLINCQFNSSISVDTAGEVDLIDCLGGDVSATNCTLVMQGGQGFGGTFTMSSAFVVFDYAIQNGSFIVDGASTVRIQRGSRIGSVGGTFEIQNGGTVQGYGPATIRTSMLIDSGATLTTANITIMGAITNNGTWNQYDTSDQVKYTPTTSADWSVAPANVLQGLDDLAGSGIVKSQTTNKFLGSPNGSSGVPSFRVLATADLPNTAILTTGANAFAADQSMGSHKLTNVANGTTTNDAVNYGQLQAVANGNIWLPPIIDPDLIDDSLSTPPGSPVLNTVYLIGPAPTGAWTAIGAGHVVYWDGVSAWVDVLGRAVAIGDRFGVTLEHGSGSEGGNMIGHHNNIAQVTTATPGSYAYTFTTPVLYDTVLVNNANSQHFAHAYSYNGTTWVEVAGPGVITAGNALQYTGNTLNVLYDNSTINLNGSNQLEVKSGGVSDTQIASGAAIARNKLAALTINRAMVTDGSGFDTVSATTDTQIGYLSTLTSNVQTQLNTKVDTVGTFDSQAPSANGLVISSTSIYAQSASATNPGLVNTTTQTLAGTKTFSSAPNFSSLTASTALVLDGSKNVASLAYSATGGTSNLVSRDANGNSKSVNWISGATNVVSAGGTTTLTAASTRLQQLTGTQNQTFQLPDATTLSVGATFEFNNNSTGTLSVVDNGSNPITTIPSGGYSRVVAIAVSTANGSWDKHFLLPANASYGTAGLTVTGTIAASNFSGSSSGTNTGDQTITLTGDVTGSGTGSFAATIASSAVTNTKMANMANNTVKANISGGTAAPSDVSAVSTSTVSTFVVRDTNANFATNMVEEGVITEASGSTYNLTISSKPTHIVTGSSATTYNFPTATTLGVGHKFLILNESTGIVTCNNSSSGLIKNVNAGSARLFILSDNSTAAGTWDATLVSISPASSSTSHQWVAYIDSDGIQHTTQPAFSDLTGTVNLATQVTGILPIGNGGTNSTTSLNNNRFMVSTGGSIVEAAAVTASKAVVSDTNGLPTASATTSTEIGYVSGVTSAIQTQLNGKQNNFTGVNISSNVTLTNNAIHFVDTSAARSLAFPAPTAEVIIIVKDSTFTANTHNITFTQHASEQIEGVAGSYTGDSNGGCWYWTSDGTNWFLI